MFSLTMTTSVRDSIDQQGPMKIWTQIAKIIDFIYQLDPPLLPSQNIAKFQFRLSPKTHVVRMCSTHRWCPTAHSGMLQFVCNFRYPALLVWSHVEPLHHWVAQNCILCHLTLWVKEYEVWNFLQFYLYTINSYNLEVEDFHFKFIIFNVDYRFLMYFSIFTINICISVKKPGSHFLSAFRLYIEIYV